MSPLDITGRTTAAGPVVEVAGDLDHAHSAVLRRAVEHLVLRPGQRLVIDLTGLEHCDSTGITTLLAARQHAMTADAALALARVPANTLRVLRMTGLDQVFTLHPDAPTA